jgi:hypothetical protein
VVLVVVVGGEGDGGAAQLFVILISAQFQNCSGTPFPSGRRGPQLGTIKSLAEGQCGPTVQLYVLYPT